MTESDALKTLNAWFSSHGSDVTQSTLEAWNIWDHRDAWVFTPGGGQRTNRLYMVRDLTVVSFALSEESVEAAYSRLDTAPDAPGLDEPKPLRIEAAMPFDLPDETYYYLEEGWLTPFPLGPMVYQVTVTAGLAEDKHWDARTKNWVPTRLLLPYKLGRGENRLYSATPQEAERWRQHRQKLWDDAHADDAGAETSPTIAADKSDAAESERISALLKELQSFPGWSGISFRGMSETAELGRTTNTAVSRGLVTTSRDSRVATENFTTPGVYAVLGTEGRGIESVSHHPEEYEVLFLPATAFGVVGTIDVDGFPIVLVRQARISADNPDVDMADFETRARNAIASGRTGAPVKITSPGKYAGDID